MCIAIESDIALSKATTAAIHQAAERALLHQGAPANALINILISDDEQLQELNREFRRIDAPTDVLSFPMDFIDPEADMPHLGVIAISYPRAQTQAEAGGHSVEAELQLLTIHGVLHLMGHDHAEEAEKTLMWQAQAEILAALGLSGIHIPE